MGICQYVVVEADVHGINLYPGKGIRNRIFLSQYMMNGTTEFGYCQEETLLSGRPCILDPGEGMHKGW